ncbi:MAG: ABC transporter substrate-binding protein [Clostridia bacterium]|nr:ABC transporter substrate-binding protein [Clostridia bacterium]
MKKAIRILSLILAVVMTVSMVACGKKQESGELAEVKVGVLKGPTGVGAVKLIEKDSSGKTIGKYDIDLYETANANALVTNVINGSVDIAAVPINTASILYAKTNGGVKVIAANALGVLSIVGYGDIAEISQLKGAIIHTVNKGATPEYILRYVLQQNGLNPDTDVDIRFYANPADAIAASVVFESQGTTSVAMIPEPALTVNLSQSPDLKVLFDMTEEWNKVSDTRLVQGVLVVRNEFLEKNPEAVDMFLEEYSESVGYVNGYPSRAAKLLVEYGIVNNETVAKHSIPNCNVVCITGSPMKKNVSGMLGVLFGSNPASIGGKLPAEDFYYVAAAVENADAEK